MPIVSIPHLSWGNPANPRCCRRLCPATGLSLKQTNKQTNKQRCSVMQYSKGPGAIQDGRAMRHDTYIYDPSLDGAPESK